MCMLVCVSVRVSMYVCVRERERERERERGGERERKKERKRNKQQYIQPKDAYMHHEFVYRDGEIGRDRRRTHRLGQQRRSQIQVRRQQQHASLRMFNIR